ncbi:MAG: FAD:protein FMN transferase [Candidatus Cloacimonadota bacterium]|nr:FAD:protein FMN transferase [Candidatus Cloacimonadota bacterium]
MKKEYLSVIVLIGLLVFGYFRYKNQVYNSQKTKWILGTQVQISAKSKDQKIDTIIENTFNLMSDYENQLSYYKDESEVSKINKNEISKPSKEVQELLEISKEMYIQSEQLFDPTIATVLDLWDFSKKEIPNLNLIETSIAEIGFDKISLQNGKLQKPENIKLNFGAIAKGYIIDKGIEFLQENGICEGSINAGGDIRYFSDNNSQIKIGVKHPRKSTSDLIAVLKVSDKAIVTSGDYEQFFDLDGKRYHHILNPKTGFPVSNMISVTVLAENTTLADALSTAVFLLGPKKGIALLKSIPNVAGMLYYKYDNEIICLKTKSIKEFLVKEYNE